MFLTDRVTVSGARRTADGYLVADAKVARTGVQQYLGSELGRPDMPVVRVYRPESEVFAQDAMHSYAYRPMTMDHPAAMVDASTWKAVAIGQTGGEVVRDGEVVRVPLVLMDAGAIKAYEDGKRELSMGYTAEIVFGDGVTPEGEQYDAVQTNLRMNHLAVVSRGRAGSEFRIGDGRNPVKQDRADNQSPKEKAMSNTKIVLVDGLSVETTDAGAQAIEKLQKQIADGAKQLQDATAAHDAALAAKDAAIAKAEAERDAAQAKVLDNAAIDARVNARADLIGTAKRIADADYTGKSDAEIRRAAVVAKLGDASIKDKSEAYVEARFDILAADAAADPVRKVLGARPNLTAVADNGYSASVDDLDYRTRNQKKEG